MQKPLSLLAQAALADESDTYSFEGQLVLPDERDKSLQVETLVSGVTSKGRRHFVSPHAELFIWRNQFVIYVRPLEKDLSGRTASIACHGVMNFFESTDDFEEYVAYSISEFSNLLKRTLTEDTLEDVRKAAALAKKKFGLFLELSALISMIGLILLWSLIKWIWATIRS